MELVDRLLSFLVGPDRSTATRQLMAAGYTEDEVRGAWNFARTAGYTESTGLGMDRLTAARKGSGSRFGAASVALGMDGPKDLEKEFRKRSREIAPPARGDFQGEFGKSVRGQARAAKAAGQRYFQVILGLTEPYQVWSLKT